MTDTILTTDEYEGERIQAVVDSYLNQEPVDWAAEDKKMIAELEANPQ